MNPNVAQEGKGSVQPINRRKENRRKGSQNSRRRDESKTDEEGMAREKREDPRGEPGEMASQN